MQFSAFLSTAIYGYTKRVSRTASAEQCLASASTISAQSSGIENTCFAKTEGIVTVDAPALQTKLLTGAPILITSVVPKLNWAEAVTKVIERCAAGGCTQACTLS